MERRASTSALAVLLLGVSLIVLDGTIVSVSLPVIIGDIGLSLTEAQWVSSIYTVVFAALLLPMGTLGDRLGRKRIFIAGLVIFAAASLIASLASSAGVLIVARGMQGIGGAMVLPSTLSTMNAVYRGSDRAMAFGLWGAAMASMAAIGPLLGGWITTQFTWPWIFLVNIPIVALVVPWSVRAIPENTGEEGTRIHIAGVVLSALSFAFIVFGLIEATTYGWFTPTHRPTIFGHTWPDVISVSALSLLIGVVLLGIFIANQARRVAAGQHVALDVTLFSIPSFSRGNIAAMTVATGEFGILFALPLYLVNVLDLSTMSSGWVLASLALGAIIAGGAARHIARLCGPARTVVMGLGLEVLGIAIAALVLSPTVSPWLLAGILAAYGFGTGLASAQLASVVLAQVPLNRSGMASAAQSTFRQIGSAIGVALAGTVLAAVMNHDLPGRLTDLGVPQEAAEQITRVSVDSAGGAMTQLAQGNDQVLSALHGGFSHGMTMVLCASGVFLVIGLIAALMLERVGQAITVDES